MAFATDKTVTKVILDNIEEAIYVRGAGRELLYVNPAAEQLSGWPSVEALQRPCFEVFGDEGAKCNLDCPIDRANRLDQAIFHTEGNLIDRRGQHRSVSVSISPVRDGEKITATVVSLRDVTQLRDLEKTNLKTLMELEAAHEKLQEGEQRFRGFAELSHDWWWETDAEHRFSYMGGPNAEARKHMMGRRRDEIVDTSLDPEAWALFKECLDNYALFRDFIYPQDLKSGRRRWVKISANPIFDANDVFLGYRGVGSDITTAVEENLTLRASAERDVLTGLLNRRGFESALKACRNDQRNVGAKFGVVLVDLDRFKAINDEHGHQAGDQVLVEQAARLVDAVRDDDCVGRLGGDEFAVLVRGLDEVASADTVGEKLCESLGRPIQVQDDVWVQPGASIGIAMFPAHGDDTAALLEAADQAMYKAKRSGKNRHAIFGG
jgi:diguanylate cyclase (GGDEF)-like protein/PAS domain S-box-containing protein